MGRLPAERRWLRMAETNSLRFTACCAGRSLTQAARAFGGLRELGAERQVFQRDLAARALVAAFDHRDGGTAPVGIFELRLHAGLADIGFGAEAGGAQFARHGSSRRPRPCRAPCTTMSGSIAPAPPRPRARKRRQQPADAEGNAGGRDRLAGEPRHQIVIAPAAADRAEHARSGPHRSVTGRVSCASNTAPV